MRILVILAALPLAACGSVAMGNDSGAKATASGAGTTRSFQVADFTKVDLRGSDDVIVKVGPAFSVRADGPSAELDRLEILKDGDTLKVGRVRNDGFKWGGGDHKGVKVYVTMPAMAGAGVAGSGDMTVDRIAGGDFAGSVAGSGDLTIDQLGANSADLSVAGSGDLTLKGGQVGRLKVGVAGSGNVDGAGFRASSADVSVAGSGNVRADVMGAATISLVGSGDVDLGSGAHCTTTKMGSGEVRCGS
jgi:hypothetical protein